MENRAHMSYIQGVNLFLDFAFSSQPSDAVIYCPCKKCRNVIFVNRQVAFEHIIVNGFLENYTNWSKHGEHVLVPIQFFFIDLNAILLIVG